MATWRLQCRTHGGIFVMPSRKGRKPVRCNDDHKCLRHPDSNGEIPGLPGVTVKDAAALKTSVVPSRAAATASKIKNNRARSKPTLKAKGGKRNLRTTVQKPAEVTVTVNASLPPAQKAKEALTAKGWTVVGRAFEGTSAELTATRDDEHIYMVWVDGKLTTQDYQLWHNDQLPEKNNRPKTELDFDPEEISDKELMHLLAGQPITWWNRLGTNEEKAIVGDKVRITHTFIGDRAEENAGERVITFVDHGGGGYRSFHVSALLKVGR